MYRSAYPNRQQALELDMNQQLPEIQRKMPVLTLFLQDCVVLWNRDIAAPSIVTAVDPYRGRRRKID